MEVRYVIVYSKGVNYNLNRWFVQEPLISQGF